MSAPVSERLPARERTRSARSGRPSAGRDAVVVPSPRRSAPTIPRQRQVAARSRAAATAYARRDQRLRRFSAADAKSAARAGRTPFVVLVMALLTVGLVATLWLSTSAAADSYRLQEVRASVAELSAQSEQLRREVASLSSAPALAQRAEELGMVPAKNPARIVVDEHGAVTVVGDPKPVAPRPRTEPAPSAASASDASPLDQPASVAAELGASASAESAPTGGGTETDAGNLAAPG